MAAAAELPLSARFPPSELPRVFPLFFPRRPSSVFSYTPYMTESAFSNEPYVTGLRSLEDSPCVVCDDGTLEMSTFTKTRKRAGTTLIVRNVSALLCDTSGDGLTNCWTRQ